MYVCTFTYVLALSNFLGGLFCSFAWLGYRIRHMAWRGRHILKHEKIDWLDLAEHWHGLALSLILCCLAARREDLQDHSTYEGFVIAFLWMIQRRAQVSPIRGCLQWNTYYEHIIHCNSAYIALENIIEEEEEQPCCKEELHHLSSSWCWYALSSLQQLPTEWCKEPIIHLGPVEYNQGDISNKTNLLLLLHKPKDIWIHIKQI